MSNTICNTLPHCRRRLRHEFSITVGCAVVNVRRRKVTKGGMTVKITPPGGGKKLSLQLCPSAFDGRELYRYLRAFADLAPEVNRSTEASGGVLDY